MGCDIHMTVEVKSDGEWKNYDHFRRNTSFGKYDDEEEFELVELCTDRNYRAFSQLCGVRSYKSDDDRKISEPKGKPDDACSYSKKLAEQWEGDAHSHSYVTLKEIIDFRRKITNSNNDHLKFIHDQLVRRAIEFWFGENYIEPENIRIVFFFDN